MVVQFYTHCPGTRWIRSARITLRWYDHGPLIVAIWVVWIVWAAHVSRFTSTAMQFQNILKIYFVIKTKPKTPELFVYSIKF